MPFSADGLWPSDILDAFDGDTDVGSASAGSAAGIGAALAPTVTTFTGPTAPAGRAAATGAALAPAQVKLSSALPTPRAAGTGAALAPTVTLSASAGVAFMQNSMGPHFGGIPRLSVELAWGADLDADSSTWDWHNISSDVLQAGGAKVTMTHGRSDEAGTTQPATATMTLDNRTGAYSLGPQSSNYPNVRRNTPVRIRVDPGDGDDYRTEFVGFANGFTPSWDITGRFATVALSASGTLRRLAQHSAPVISSMRRAVLAIPAVVAYWPCEEVKGASTISSGLPGGTPMQISGLSEQPFPDFAADTTFACSAALPTIKQTTWRGQVPAYTPSPTVPQWEVRFLMKTPTDPLNGTSCVLLSVNTTGSIARWDLAYTNADGGDLYVAAYDTSGEEVFNAGSQFNINNTLRQYSFFVFEDDSDVSFGVAALGVGYTSGGGASGTVTGATMGVATSITVCPNGDYADAVIGHVYLTSDVDDLTINQDELNANAGETATARLTRLCEENAVPITITGSSSVTMGPQSVAPLLTLLRECEAADQGLLLDGLDAGLTYIARSERESVAASLTLNAANGEPALAIAPVDDDQRNRNRATATRTAGASATYEDTDGPLGTAAIGIYDSSVTVNTNDDSRVVDYASWLVHQGTIEGYRHPSVTLDLEAKPGLAPDWLETKPSSRIDVTNIVDVRTQYPDGTVSLLLEGYTQAIDQFRWDATLNCSPFEPWRIGTLAADTGDTGEYVLRAISDGSTLAAGASVGATSLSVATSSGPLWTTTADDFPLQVSIAGTPITVTAISGASSPQTFTVTGSTVVRALSSGAAVELWAPTVPGI